MAVDLMNFDLPQNKSSIIKVIGVGGGGGNAVNHMFRQGITDVDFVICNTDAQALENSEIPNKIQLGETLTQGRGAGNKPEQGKQAAIESLDQITDILQHNTKMVFITAGMGGGTGTGAAPIIAGEAKDNGILTVGIVTLPFRFEGKRRMNQAIEGLNEMRKYVDSLLVINNEKLREIHGNLPLTQAFERADNVLSVAAKGIAEIITVHGSVNVDFADVNTVMANSGVALMGSSTSEGENRAIDAVEDALSSPLLNNNDIIGAKNILLNIASGPSNEVTMDEIGQITDYVQEAAGMNADIIWGNTLDENLGKNIGITIIATGFGTESIPELAAAQVDEKEKFNLGNADAREVIQPTPKVEPTPKEEEIPFEVIDKEEPNNTPEPDFDYSIPSNNDEHIERFTLFGNEQTEEKSAKVELNTDITPAPANADVQVEKMIKPKVSYNNEKDLEALENVPAYKRKNIELEDDEEGAGKEVSRFTLDDQDGTTKLSQGNSFLFDNVD